MKDKIKIYLALILLVSLVPARASDLAPLESWLAAQANYRSVQAEFIQTRQLASVRDPLTAKGEMWAKHPGYFLWDIGRPSKVRVVRNPAGYTYFNLAEMKAVVMAPDSRYAKQFAFLNAEMPASLAELQKRFKIEKTSMDAQKIFSVTMSPVARRMRSELPWVMFQIDSQKNQLVAFEIHLKDKTKIRTVFTKYQWNVKIPDSRFQLSTAGFEVIRK
ncbi:LolA family protein [Persicirhabdus sediminis]|uniref:Outer membrane lipoprotein carrier protein LolA n=1 Tax=Persicirhabdus sediminis TaxID=454144 RepID=A0A8J7MEK6_9BACT|nr:outer membrane lipoprotein carrier protein LolA [Persicirhabdus sediminis]MBK1791871.1 outer membrane lipoprotein carrier protein LolA [Persicirhabdus sediminis]